MGDRLRHLILPAAVLIFFNLGTHVRYMRSGMLDVMHQDFIRTARAKGLGRNGRDRQTRRAQRDPAPDHHHRPRAAVLFNGALITETIFSCWGWAGCSSTPSTARTTR